MQSLDFTPNTQSTIITQNSPEEWWEEARDAAQIFFDLVDQPPVNKPEAKMKRIVRDLEAARTEIEQVDYPFETYHARSYLLAAVTDLLTGLHRIATGEESIGHAYVKAAQIELNFLNEELADLKLA